VKAKAAKLKNITILISMKDLVDWFRCLWFYSWLIYLTLKQW